MSFTWRTLPGTRLRATAATLAIAGTMVIAGCGGGSAPAPASSAAAPSSVAASIPAAGSAGTGAGGGTCGEATAALVKKQLTQAGIVSITTEGGCHDVTIVTTLAAADVAQALAICDAAAVIAYPVGDISSITVTGANNKELSIGIKGQPCIGEP
jgi:hypothetical protein